MRCFHTKKGLHCTCLLSSLPPLTGLGWHPAQAIDIIFNLYQQQGRNIASCNTTTITTITTITTTSCSQSRNCHALLHTEPQPLDCNSCVRYLFLSFGGRTTPLHCLSSHNATSMPVAAVGLLVALSVESFKASSRFFNKRKSKKHGYASLRTDALGRPISEDGKILSKNEARALAAHHKEIERIRTAEREWRAKGERLPAYSETDNAAIIESLRRPSTAPASGRSSTSVFREPSTTPLSSTLAVVALPDAVAAATSIETSAPSRPRALSTASTPLVSNSRLQREARNDDLAVSTFQALDNGAFAIRRRTRTLVLPSIPSTNETSEIQDIFQHDGMDWRRATWEAPPLYDRV